jgi:hydroxymethylpyrimidine/phosphomethylpyrimidine kinase
MTQAYPKVLVIAGSDSGGCSGLQADLKVLNVLGCHASTVITAVTAQNTIGVQAIHPLPSDIIRQQLHSVLTDIGADAIKIGMLYNEEIIDAVACILEQHTDIPIVIDPVQLASSNATTLLQTQALHFFIKRLLPLATLITPNLEESKNLLEAHSAIGCSAQKSSSSIGQLPIEYCLVTNGDADHESIKDILYQNGKQKVCYLNPKITTANNRGTGCSLSSAIAGYVASGFKVEQAIPQAIQLVRAGLENGKRYQLTKAAGPLCFKSV